MGQRGQLGKKTGKTLPFEMEKTDTQVFEPGQKKARMEMQAVMLDRLLTKKLSNRKFSAKGMEYKSNTKQALARIKRIRELIAAGTFSDALVGGLNGARAVMLLRIFNQSNDAKDQPLGKYSGEEKVRVKDSKFGKKGEPYYTGYKKKRVKRGRQIVNKDLQMDGTLKASIETVTVNNTKAELRFTNEETARIARHLETQLFSLRQGKKGNAKATGRAPIFEFSKDEAEIARTMTRDLLKQKFNF